MKPEVILEAQIRLNGYVNRTPLLQSPILNKILKASIYFKHEGFQKVGAFKARGALNALLTLKEQDKLPKKVITYSSGNHAQAIAWAASKVGIEATVIIPKVASAVKKAAARAYGAKVIIAETRQKAETLTLEATKDPDILLISPYDNDMVIAGQGTAALEAWQEEGNFDAIFAPCGGGGLLSGTYLATRLMSKSAKVFAGEPITANDAARSYKTGKIVKYDDAPNTIADGVRTLSISERTFHYLKKLDGFYEISEEEIIYWTQWLIHLLKISIEPTSALGMAAAHKWLSKQKSAKKILIILSGANADQATFKTVWEKDYLAEFPQKF